jgi:pyruvate/2-oxoglutarate dehydrogenase complex dihydrolipoamide dehydrogenase (E3) component
MPGKYDVAIFGAGTAGLSVLRQIPVPTDLFLRVNAGPYGNTCAGAGCMTSTMLSVLIATGSRPNAVPPASGLIVQSAARPSGVGWSMYRRRLTKQI